MIIKLVNQIAYFLFAFNQQSIAFYFYHILFYNECLKTEQNVNFYRNL